MDSHDLGRGRGDSVPDVLGDLAIPVLVLSIASDVLYPPQEQEELHNQKLYVKFFPLP